MVRKPVSSSKELKGSDEIRYVIGVFYVSSSKELKDVNVLKGPERTRVSFILKGIERFYLMITSYSPFILVSSSKELKVLKVFK